nr:GNAT family N-acetyltransferase [Pantoea stewartii]
MGATAVITVAVVEAATPALQVLTARLSAELSALTGDAGTQHFSAPEAATWVLARDSQGKAIGCGALVHVSPETAELKRMFSTRDIPGTGAAVLAALEQIARARGYRALRCSTRRMNTRAVAFYHRCHFQETAPYGAYVDKPASVCLIKAL